MLNQKDYSYFAIQQSLIFDDFLSEQESKDMMMKDVEYLSGKIINGDILRMEE